MDPRSVVNYFNSSEKSYLDEICNAVEKRVLRKMKFAREALFRRLNLYFVAFGLKSVY